MAGCPMTAFVTSLTLLICLSINYLKLVCKISKDWLFKVFPHKLAYVTGAALMLFTENCPHPLTLCPSRGSQMATLKIKLFADFQQVVTMSWVLLGSSSLTLCNELAVR